MTGYLFEERFSIFVTGRFSGYRGGGHGWRGHPGGGMGGGGIGGGGFLRAGRMLKSADLQLLLLALLETRPRHGYDLIKSIQEMAGGAYVPSPGMVYPALNFLEELDQISAQQDGAKKQYSLTNSGQAALNENRARVLTLIDSLERAGQRLTEPAAAAAGLSPAPTLEAVRRDLKAVLFDCLDESPAEQQRVAGILERTIAEIRKR